MRKFRSLFFMLLTLSSMSFLTSCGDEDEPNPKATITFDPSSETTQAAPGEALNVKFVVTSTDKLKSFVLTKSTAGVSQEVTNVTSFPNAGFEYHLTETVATSAVVGSQIVYTVSATTNADEVTTRTYTVNVVAAPVTYTAKMLGNQSNPTLGSFFATKDGAVLKSADAATRSADVDFAYYYSLAGTGQVANDKATIAAPTDANANIAFPAIASWTKKNNTAFKKTTITDAEYTAASFGNQFAAIFNGTSGNGSTKVTDLQAGTIFAFKTESGKYGLAKVLTAPTVPTSGNTASQIEVEVKVQP